MPNSARVLMYLGDPLEAQELAHALAPKNLQAQLASTRAQALSLLAGPQRFAAVLAEDAFGGRDLLARARTLAAPPAVVLLTGFGTVQDALAALREGAHECLPRPVSHEQVVLVLLRAIEQSQLASENERLRKAARGQLGLEHLGGKDPRMQQVLAQALAVCDTRATVLIEGESGTGKSQIARAIHAQSSRAKAPFVTLNCGALPPTLQESELFGHSRGAFTGAIKDKPGLAEAAHGGTMFLDEISSAPLELQVKLLRVIQERAFERVGESKTRTVDVRWIAASNRDLEAEVAQGRFRDDLFWRLNVVHLVLPPLRERRDDIPTLALGFLQRFAADYGKSGLCFSPRALALLASHAWPGNIRQLENCVERGVLLCSTSQVEASDLGLARELTPALGESQALYQAGKSLRDLLEGPEREILVQALKAHGGNRERTAKALGINRTTLFHKMRRLGLLASTLS